MADPAQIPWTLDEAENKITRGNEVSQLTPKASAVLSCLLRRSGQIVSKEEILTEVWSGLNVTENLIREYIFDIRVALGDDARNPRHIETVRGRGFRLLGGIEPTHPVAQGRQPAQKPIIGVLNTCGPGSGARLKDQCDRVVVRIIDGLAGHHDIEVVSHRSSRSIKPEMDTREAAGLLSADYLVDCGLDVAGEVLTGSFQLIDGQTGKQIWTQAFSMEDQGVGTEFDDLASQVVNALVGWHGELHLAEFRLASRKDPGNLNAFEHFVRGCDLELNFDVSSVQKSLKHLERSLEMDPSFARCWVVKAIMLQWSYDMYAVKDKTLLTRSQDALAKAAILDPRDPLTLSLIALQHARNGDLFGARAAMDTAESTCSMDSEACVCLATSVCVLTGEFEKSRALLEKGLALNRVHPVWYRFVEARLRFFFGEYELSIAASRSGPQRVSSMIYRCLSRAMLGQVGPARVDHAGLLDRYPNFDFGFYADYFPIIDPSARQRYDMAVARVMTEDCRPMPA